ncbi:MAG: hypothetical protein KY476_18720, partial [Planctomycetes bacterium]|nr:hypothetical protein [Planctomycetota bacterium]
DDDIARVAPAVRAQRAHLGFVIDDGGQQCALLDERGRLLEPMELTAVLARIAAGEQPGAAVVVDETAAAAAGPAILAAGGRLVACSPTAAAMFRTMRDTRAILGAAGGRWWFRDGRPVCDAIVTLSRVLDALSRSDAPFSSVVATAAPRDWAPLAAGS